MVTETPAATQPPLAARARLHPRLISEQRDWFFEQERGPKTEMRPGQRPHPPTACASTSPLANATRTARSAWTNCARKSSLFPRSGTLTASTDTSRIPQRTNRKRLPYPPRSRRRHSRIVQPKRALRTCSCQRRCIRRTAVEKPCSISRPDPRERRSKRTMSGGVGVFYGAMESKISIRKGRRWARRSACGRTEGSCRPCTGRWRACLARTCRETSLGA